MRIIIRKATKDDLLPVLDLVKELALYEKASDAVTATLLDYKNDFEEKLFEVLLAENENHIIGIALYYMAYSTWKGKMLYLEDLIVSQKYRRNGIGQLLFDSLKKEAKEKKALLIKWQVLDWNLPAIHFYKKNNAIIENDWLTGKLYIK